MYGIQYNSKKALSFNLAATKTVMLPRELNSASTCLVLQLGKVIHLAGKCLRNNSQEYKINKMATVWN
jgi:hypothetical protein